MNKARLRTILVGFGKVGAEYATDPLMARYYPYSTHAQVLSSHPDFSWDAVVDISDSAREIAQKQWNIPCAVHAIEDLPHHMQPEVAVIATPPQQRLRIVEQLPSLRAVLVEKPLGLTVDEGRDFLEYCYRHEIAVQVNLWRRADETFRTLAAGRLIELIGHPQAVFGIYGNGLLNNGIHMVDFVRMLFGEIAAIQAIPGVVPYPNGPISGDVNVPFNLRLENGLAISMHAMDFMHYRENGLDIWGEKGRLSIMQEGLGIFLYPRCENRAMQGEMEVASDRYQILNTTVGEAFYHLYSNLASALNDKVLLCSPGESSLRSEQVVEAIMMSSQNNGDLIELS